MTNTFTQDIIELIGIDEDYKQMPFDETTNWKHLYDPEEPFLVGRDC